MLLTTTIFKALILAPHKRCSLWLAILVIHTFKRLYGPLCELQGNP